MNIINDKQKKLNQMRVEILKHYEKTADIPSLKDARPFEIEWSFGWSSKIGLINIPNAEPSDNLLRAFIVSAQVGIIIQYNHMTDRVKTLDMLTGHRQCICSFDVNSDGRWVVTAEDGDKSMLIVWDSFKMNPILTILFPLKMGAAIVVKFSIDSKYLITVSIDSDDEQTIGLWDWMLGLEEPTYSTKLDKSFKPVIHLSCCYDNPNFYCFTTTKHVFFMTLVEDVKTLMINVPKKDPEQKKYTYTQSTYLTNFRQVVSASTGGSVTVWDDTNYNTKKLQITTITNNKQYLKNIHLDDYPITAIICQKNIITGNTNGDIFIYDQSLLILYHLKELVGNSITSISMINAKIVDKKNVFGTSMLKTCEHLTKSVPYTINICSEHCKRNTTRDSEDIRRFGTDFTTQQEFKCDPFLISTRNCKIFQIDVDRKCCVQMFEQFDEAPVTALDAHPKQSFVVLGNSIGGLSMYNYVTKKLTKTITSAANSEEIKNNNSQVTSIKYSCNGLVLCYGCANGSFWFLDPHHLTPVHDKAFRWNESPVRLITFCRSSRYVVYTDNTLGVYLYRILSWDKFTVKYHGCCEVHKSTIRDISVSENQTGLTIYSIGADHRIAIIEFDDTVDGGKFELVRTMKTESWHEPLCMVRSMDKSGVLNLVISGSDHHITAWNNSRCVRTTRGVNLESPITVMKILYNYETRKNKNVIIFCNDTDLGILQRPVNGNPFRNAAILSSGTKLIDFAVSEDNQFVFCISENSSSVLMWSLNSTYLPKLEGHCTSDLKAYSCFLEGGENGKEIRSLKEYFYCLQIVQSANPATTTLCDIVDVCAVSYPMRAMGYFPSKSEISNMIYEMHGRDTNKIGHPETLITFEEFVILYLNYKPLFELTIGDIRKAFDRMVLYDHSVNPEGEEGVLTRETFVHIMKNIGEKMSFRELEIIVRVLLRKTKDLSSAGSDENINLIYALLPPTLTFEFIMSDLLGIFNQDEQK